MLISNVFVSHDPGKTPSPAQLVGLLVGQFEESKISGQINFQFLSTLRWANEIGTKMLSIQLPKQSQDMLFRATPHKRVGEAHNGNGVVRHQHRALQDPNLNFTALA